MNKKKRILFIILFVVVIIIIVVIYRNKKTKYSINTLVDNYDLSDINIENEYLDYLKEYIYPVKLRAFIENNFVPTSLLGGNDTGIETINLMKDIGYELLFTSLFDQARTNFDDCPITNRFNDKFNTNLFNYFNLKESEDCEIMCSQNSKERTITIEVFGNFKNTEPTYWTTHHFKYTLDDEGNVDDIIFEYTEQ